MASCFLFLVVLAADFRLEPASHRVERGEALAVRVVGVGSAAEVQDPAVYGRLAYNMLSPRVANGVVEYTARIKEEGLLILAARSGRRSAKAVLWSGASAAKGKVPARLGWVLEFDWTSAGHPDLFFRGKPAPESIAVRIACGAAVCIASATEAGESTSISYPR